MEEMRSGTYLSYLTYTIAHPSMRTLRNTAHEVYGAASFV